MNKQKLQIYNHLMDDESKFIFEKRVCHYITGDYRYIADLIRHLPQKQELNHVIEKCGALKDSLILYGAGNDYDILHRLYPDFNFYAFCDRNEQKQLKGWRGKKVISPDTLVRDYSSNPIMICTTGFHQEIKAYLLNNGFPPDQLIDIGEITGPLYDAQYFDREILKPQPHEIFVDGGAYDLGTAHLFLDWCAGDYDAIYSFEPDGSNYKMCLERLHNAPIKNLTLLNKGLWDREETLSFQINGQGSQITDNIGQDGKTVYIRTDSIDNVLQGAPATLIKLDVEGAELKALSGARETIRNHHPRLAVCLYHKPEDILEIPAYILSLSDEYRFFIRHYQMSDCETVLYGV